MSIIIYHNPSCSKSRKTLELLKENDIQPTIVEYIKTPPTVDKLKEIISLLGMTSRDLIRKKEDEYFEYGLDDRSLSDEQIIAYMAKYPILIERPIVLANGKAAIGRPPEQVLKII
jgi:arsenate reductase